MNGNLLTSLFTGLLLAGGTFAVALAEGPCQKVEIADDEECRGDSDYPVVTINTEGKDITVDPLVVCAARGAKVEFRVFPLGAYDLGSILIMPKVIVKVGPRAKINTWLLRTNSPDASKIKVGVPRWIETKDYEYSIWLADDRCVDPRVHVEK
jgi:hypothetical protein